MERRLRVHVARGSVGASRIAKGSNGLAYRDDPRNPFQFDRGGTFVGQAIFRNAQVLSARFVDGAGKRHRGATDRGRSGTAGERQRTFPDEAERASAPRAGLAGFPTANRSGQRRPRDRICCSASADSGCISPLTGCRDLRRLSRSTANDGYGRDPETVFPTGSWFRGGVYGTDINFPIPIEELNNPQRAGSGSEHLHRSRSVTGDHASDVKQMREAEHSASLICIAPLA